MFRIDKFLEYYDSLSTSGVTMQLEGGAWVNAVPEPYEYGLLSKDFWIERRQRLEDAKAVRRGDAIAVTWGKKVNTGMVELQKENILLREIVDSLLDGLESNESSERGGLTNEEWEKRIQKAKNFRKKGNNE